MAGLGTGHTGLYWFDFMRRLIDNLKFIFKRINHPAGFVAYLRRTSQLYMPVLSDPLVNYSFVYLI